MASADAPSGVVTFDSENLVDEDGSVFPEVVQNFGGISDEALMTLHGVITNELGNRGVQIRGEA